MAASLGKMPDGRAATKGPSGRAARICLSSENVVKHGQREVEEVLPARATHELQAIVELGAEAVAGVVPYAPSAHRLSHGIGRGCRG